MNKLTTETMKKTAAALAKTTGYRLHLMGEVTWHRTLEGAKRAGMRQAWCSTWSVTDCATGETVA